MTAAWLAVALLASAARGAPAAPPLKTARLTFPDGAAITVDVADTPATRERGLMFRKRLPRDYGMLFAFPREMPLTFWMKNTFVPLDMVFITAEKKISRVHRRVRASTAKTTDAEVARAGGVGQWVLELPAGAADRRKLELGQTLEFDVPVPER